MIVVLMGGRTRPRLQKQLINNEKYGKHGNISLWHWGVLQGKLRPQWFLQNESFIQRKMIEIGDWGIQRITQMVSR